MSGYRRAAVALHGLGAQDRGYILDALPGSDRTELLACLAELDELGFSSDPSSLEDALGSAPPAPGGAGLNPSERMARATSAQMFALLEDEPNALIAQVLGMQRWVWGEPCLALFAPARQDKIRAALAAPVAAPARAAFLLGAVAARLEQAAPTPASSARNPRGGGLRALLARFSTPPTMRSN
ncbi:hypothetical protein F2P44_15985 [Massilia sp. CCM 8695]|uniref:Uncharacterized protein n=1 Tax=Massilia frigida TaxID=2609281 RepID=A0ABX0N5W1_9BURK|nr:MULTISPECIES: hypothetical protein [Massilia]MDM5179191.1 hypothetical protein [Massilia sp. DJPM01]NHZ80762.1 hypothetical protein [Massilia frigida]